MDVRQKIAKICFWLSSLFRAAGVFIRSRDRTIVADALSLPGWFILDDYIIFMDALDDPIFKTGFTWHCWPMPDLWCDQMSKYKH